MNKKNKVNVVFWIMAVLASFFVGQNNGYSKCAARYNEVLLENGVIEPLTDVNGRDTLVWSYSLIPFTVEPKKSNNGYDN